MYNLVRTLHACMYDQPLIDCITEFHTWHYLLVPHKQIIRAGICEKAAAD